MNYSITRRDGVQVLHLSRMLSDLDNRLILDEINRHLQDGDTASLIIDLAALEFLDSNGINLLLALRQRSGQFGCAMALTEPQPYVRRVLEITRLQTVFHFIPNPEDSRQTVA